MVCGVMEFGMSRRIKPKEKYVHISVKAYPFKYQSSTTSFSFDIIQTYLELSFSGLVSCAYFTVSMY